MRINHNISAINAHRQLTSNQGTTSKSLQKLSSGLRINSAGDDAAGLAISEKMRTQIRGLEKAQSNAQDSISLIQTAEGALQEVSDILQRMRELGVQSMNGILSDAEKDAIAAEMTQLRQEVDRIAETSKFNNTYLLKGTLGMHAVTDPAVSSIYGAKGQLLEGVKSIDVAAAEKEVTYEISTLATNGGTYLVLDYGIKNLDGTTSYYSAISNLPQDPSGKTTGILLFTNTKNDSSAGIKIQVENLDLTTLAGRTITTSEGGSTKLHIGANSEDAPLEIEIPDLRSKALRIDELSVANTEDAKVTLEKIDSALTVLNAARGDLGAYQNRLEYTLNSLAASAENLTAAESRIRDVDMAKEMMSYTQANILNQSATAMLAQANQLPQSVLQLLQGI